MTVPGAARPDAGGFPKTPAGDLASCRFCGCTEDRACCTPHGPCRWLAPGLCSNPLCVLAARALGIIAHCEASGVAIDGRYVDLIADNTDAELDEIREALVMLGIFDVDGTPFIHVSPSPDACDHVFYGWREFADGNGGEQVCEKCGMGAMEHSMKVGL